MLERVCHSEHQGVCQRMCQETSQSVPLVQQSSEVSEGRGC